MTSIKMNEHQDVRSHSAKIEFIANGGDLWGHKSNIPQEIIEHQVHSEMRSETMSHIVFSLQ